MNNLFRKATIAKRFSEQELNHVKSEFELLRQALLGRHALNPLGVWSSVSSFYLYALGSEDQKNDVIDFVESFINDDYTRAWSESIQQLTAHVYADLQMLRIGGLIEKINDQKSLTDAEHAHELFSSIQDSRLTGLYENRIEELNIDFTVNILPFKMEVLDPRIVRIKSGKTNEMHRHAHETVFIFLEGEGKVIVDQFENVVKPGDFAFIPRWSNHQSINTGSEDLVFLALADFGLTGKSFMGNYLKTTRLKEQ